jgi:hypothetical protein
MFKMPKLSVVARNALKAHLENRLEATTTKREYLDPHYLDPDGCCCALGASMPPDIALMLDKEKAPGIWDLTDHNLVWCPEEVRHYARLQKMHDNLVSARYNRSPVEVIAEKTRTLLDHLEQLAERKD